MRFVKYTYISSLTNVRPEIKKAVSENHSEVFLEKGQTNKESSFSLNWSYSPLPELDIAHYEIYDVTYRDYLWYAFILNNTLKCVLAQKGGDATVEFIGLVKLCFSYLCAS